jgi:hypothetical protein
MALGGREIENFDVISLAALAWGLPICVSSTSFQKSSTGWPQQPPTERVSDISEKLDFLWSIPQKGTIIGHFGAKNDPTIRISNCFWWNEAVDVIKAIEVVEAVEVIEAADVLRPEKSQLGTSESSKFLNSALKKYFLGVKNHEISRWILSPFLPEAVEASLCYFFENWLMKHKWVTLVTVQSVI